MIPHQTRRCIVCGRRDEKQLLARFAKSGARIVFDSTQTEPGRGVYVHPRPECFSRLTEVKLWQRSFGRKGGEVSRESILAAADDAREVLRRDL